MEKLYALKERLEKIGYTARVFENAQQAKDYLLNAIAATQSVGVGGSMTVQQLGMEEALRARGQTVHWHWRSNYDDEVRRAANAADIYLCSANAITMDGRIVSVDGYGNRLAATLFGPGKVYLILGANKVVESLDAAMDRIKNVACPANARRLGLRTPCAALGRCTDCASPQRMCRATLILDRKPNAHPMEVLLVGEELGY